MKNFREMAEQVFDETDGNTDILKFTESQQDRLLKYYLAENYPPIDLVALASHAISLFGDETIGHVVNNFFTEGESISENGIILSRELVRALLKFCLPRLQTELARIQIAIELKEQDDG